MDEDFKDVSLVPPLIDTFLLHTTLHKSKLTETTELFSQYMEFLFHKEVNDDIFFDFGKDNLHLFTSYLSDLYRLHSVCFNSSRSKNKAEEFVKSGARIPVTWQYSGVQYRSQIRCNTSKHNIIYTPCSGKKCSSCAADAESRANVYFSPLEYFSNVAEDEDFEVPFARCSHVGGSSEFCAKCKNLANVFAEAPTRPFSPVQSGLKFNDRFIVGKLYRLAARMACGLNFLEIVHRVHAKHEKLSFSSTFGGLCTLAERDIECGEILCEYQGSFISTQKFALRCAEEYAESFDLFPEAAFHRLTKGKIWDSYRLTDGSTIDSDSHRGAWLNTKPSRAVKFPNCVTMPFWLPDGQFRLYCIATSVIPRAYPIFQKYDAQLNLCSPFEHVLLPDIDVEPDEEDTFRSGSVLDQFAVDTSPPRYRLPIKASRAAVQAEERQQPQTQSHKKKKRPLSPDVCLLTGLPIVSNVHSPRPGRPKKRKLNDGSTADVPRRRIEAFSFEEANEVVKAFVPYMLANKPLELAKYDVARTHADVCVDAYGRNYCERVTLALNDWESYPDSALKVHADRRSVSVESVIVRLIGWCLFGIQNNAVVSIEVFHVLLHGQFDGPTHTRAFAKEIKTSAKKLKKPKPGEASLPAASMSDVATASPKRRNANRQSNPPSAKIRHELKKLAPPTAVSPPESVVSANSVDSGFCENALRTIQQQGEGPLQITVPFSVLSSITGLGLSFSAEKEVGPKTLSQHNQRESSTAAIVNKGRTQGLALSVSPRTNASSLPAVVDLSDSSASSSGKSTSGSLGIREIDVSEVPPLWKDSRLIPNVVYRTMLIDYYERNLSIDDLVAKYKMPVVDVSNFVNKVRRYLNYAGYFTSRTDDAVVFKHLPMKRKTAEEVALANASAPQLKPSQQYICRGCGYAVNTDRLLVDHLLSMDCSTPSTSGTG